MTTKIVGFVLFYIGIAIVAQLAHLVGGVLSVGVDETYRQVREFYDDVGPVWYAVFVLTAGLFPRRGESA